ncbi:hypothetical protein HU200_007853 [Digitaria exilis]|uniref:Uncharacterized protein n=1 Tax=Digitaria exilis TaxID=1010633 RepID=A0A835KSE4_9POAL|nr:hypothetical protein HU200_007853 [Digitaria exilis]
MRQTQTIRAVDGGSYTMCSAASVQKIQVPLSPSFFLRSVPPDQAPQMEAKAQPRIQARVERGTHAAVLPVCVEACVQPRACRSSWIGARYAKLDQRTFDLRWSRSDPIPFPFLYGPVSRADGPTSKLQTCAHITRGVREEEAATEAARGQGTSAGRNQRNTTPQPSPAAPIRSRPWTPRRVRASGDARSMAIPLPHLLSYPPIPRAKFPQLVATRAGARYEYCRFRCQAMPRAVAAARSGSGSRRDVTVRSFSVPYPGVILPRIHIHFALAFVCQITRGSLAFHRSLVKRLPHSASSTCGGGKDGTMQANRATPRELVLLDPSFAAAHPQTTRFFQTSDGLLRDDTFFAPTLRAKSLYMYVYLKTQRAHRAPRSGHAAFAGSSNRKWGIRMRALFLGTCRRLNQRLSTNCKYTIFVKMRPEPADQTLKKRDGSEGGIQSYRELWLSATGQVASRQQQKIPCYRCATLSDAKEATGRESGRRARMSARRKAVITHQQRLLQRQQTKHSRRPLGSICPGGERPLTTGARGHHGGIKVIGTRAGSRPMLVMSCLVL